MIRRGFGTFSLCAAALVLTSCSSSTAPSNNEQFTLTGSWGGAVTDGPPGAAYGVTLSEISANPFWISYSGMYAGSNGIALVVARQARAGRSVEISFNTSQFQGNFTDANTVVGRISISSYDYPLTLVRQNHTETLVRPR